MTKIVVNRCYGGFGLSQEATLRLIDLKSELIRIMPVAEYGESWNLRKKATNDRGYSYEPIFPDVLEKDGFVYFLRHDGNRADADLVRVVEELGRASWGKHAFLEVVEIPDDVDWTIEEYDGQEWVAEVHRTW